MGRKLKVAILADIPVEAVAGKAAGRGGGHASTWLPQLADAFENTNLDLDFTWVRIRPKATANQDIHIGRQRFITLKGINSRLDFYLYNYHSRILLRKALHEINPDLIHTWGTEKPYTAAVLDFDGPSLLSVQGCLTAFQKVASLPLHQRIAAQMEPHRIRHATRVTCESLWSAEQIHKLSPSHFPDIVDYGVHPCFYEAKWMPDPENPYLVYSGSLERRKGFDLLLEAVRNLPDRTWQLYILGDGPLYAEGEAMNLPNVRWLGSLPWDSMISILSRSWGLIVPTRADTGPTVVKEARVIGLPVLASNHGGLRDYIIDGVNGYKIEPLNAEQIASAMSRLMTNFSHTVTVGNQNHLIDRERFQPSKTADHFAQIYREMLVCRNS